MATWYGTPTDDRFVGTDEDDFASGGDGNDTISGGNGNDELLGDAGDDILAGNAGDDVLRSGSGTNRLNGGEGNDILYVEGINDVATGSTGNDTIIITSQLLGGRIDGGGDTDTLIFQNAGFGTTSGTARFVNFQTVSGTLHGTSGNDVLDLSGLISSRLSAGPLLYGPASFGAPVAHVQIEGLLGNDTITGGRERDYILGGDGDDIIFGGEGTDYLYGDAGNDIVNGGGGSDFLDGGNGVDLASYSNFFESYDIRKADDSYTVRGTTSEGIDNLKNFEYISFRDGQLQFDPDAKFAQVLRAYDTILGRTPDQIGLDFYVDLMEDRKVTLIDVANDLSASPEFQAATGGLSNSQFVDYIYRHALGRDPDEQGKAYYTSLLDNGTSRGAFVVDLSESAEHRALTATKVAEGFFNTDDTYQSIALLYDGFAGRLPDGEGLTFYAERVKSGSMTLSQVADDFASSPEFKSLIEGKTNGEIVDFIYQNTLDRSAEPGGKAFYTEQLDKGVSAAGVLLDVALSQEHYNLYSPHILHGIDII